MKHLLYAILFLTLTAACKKKTMVVIQAQNYLDNSDGSDYAGMSYSIVESWTPVYDLKTKRVAEGVLDANGHASFDLKMKNNRKYDLGIQTPDNVCYTEITLQERLDHVKNNTFNFNYATCGELDIKSNNINCEGNSDELRFRYYYSDNPDTYIYTGFGNLTDWNPQVSITGCQDYSNVNIYNSRPSGNYILEWQVIRPSGTKLVVIIL